MNKIIVDVKYFRNIIAILKILFTLSFSSLYASFINKTLSEQKVTRQ